MKVSLSKEQLTEALSVAVTAISTNSTLPVMSGILMKAQEKSVIFESTDLDSSCRVITSALVEEEGKSVLPGKLLFDIVKSLEDSKVSITTDEAKAFITCEKAAFSTNVLNPEEFPEFPQIQAQSTIEIEFSKFQNMIKKVIKAASKDESKGIFTGVFLEIKEGYARAVTSDSYRVAIAQEKTEVNNAIDFNAVVPPHFLNEIISLNANDEKVEVSYSENQVLLKIGQTTFINRKLQGQFPDYKKLINDGNETTVVVDKSSFVSAIKRVSVLRDENTPINFDVDIKKETLQLSVNATSSGAATEILQVKCTGENCNVGFDANYLMDGLNSVSTNDVLFTLSSSKQPAHIAPCVANRENFDFDEVKENKENMLNNKFLYLVMPVIQTN